MLKCRCFMMFFLALMLMSAPARAKKIPLSLVMVGDVGFNRHRVDVYPEHMDVFGKKVPFRKMTRKIERFIDGDINFGNLETVVTDSNDFGRVEKTYNFRSHPNSVRLLQKIGFNLLSIANNHTRDDGDKGIKETRKWLNKLAKEKDLWFAGAGRNLEEAASPTVFTIRKKGRKIRIAMAAVSIGTRATSKRGGNVSVHRPDEALKRLKAAKADIRILSMHGGKERALRPVSYQKHIARKAVKEYDVDIVIGHHPHVVQGIERYRKGLIFYSLGNFMIRGCRNMGRVKELRGTGDFGLLARLEMTWDTHRGLRFDRVEALPVYDMHSGPHPFKDKDQARARIKFLNSLSKEFARKDPAIVFEEVKGRFFHVFKGDEEKGSKKKSRKKSEKKKK